MPATGDATVPTGPDCLLGGDEVSAGAVLFSVASGGAWLWWARWR